MRLDKYLSMLQILSRKDSKRLIKKGYFIINDEVIYEEKYDVQDGDILSRDDIDHVVKTSYTILINKPAGYISSDIDEHGRPSYKQLLSDCPYTAMLHIAGRLDVDTEGLILASSEGQLIHRIISPKLHLPKTYLVTTRDPLTEALCASLRAGVTLEDGYHTLPAQARILESNLLELIITEGKFHQVKRMLIAVGNEVTHLKRTKIGPWSLEQVPACGWLELSPDAISLALGRKITT